MAVAVKARTKTEEERPISGLPFQQIWMVASEFVAKSGERQVPICMVAEEFYTGERVQLWQDELQALDQAPFDVGPDSCLVALFASAELACFRALGWSLSMNTIDLFAEHRTLTNGERLLHGNSLLGAARRLGVSTMGAKEKETMRDLVMGGGPWSDIERAQILDYCG